MLKESILPLLGKSTKGMELMITDAFKEKQVGLSKVQFVLLKVVSENNGIPQNDLAFITNRDKASLAKLISTLEQKKYLERVNSTSDGRIKHIHLTENGDAILSKAIPIVSAMVDEIHQDIDDKEMEITIKVLKEILKKTKFEEITGKIK